MSTGEAQRRYGCDFCDLRFKDALTLKRHTNVKHTQEETHVCDHCAAVFYTKYKMDLHLASKHGINDQFKCEKCNQFLMSEWSLLKHRRKCSTNPCPVCGKEFLSKWKLGNHVKGHLNYRSHICDECGKDFLHSFTLVEHIEIVHQGKRPFQCETCSKTFSRKGSLRTHKLLHSGMKPFPCPLCDKKCREKIQLIKHLLKKHQIQECDIQNYVIMMPKKEVVMNEDMQNLLQNMGQVKTEPVDDKNEANIDTIGTMGGIDQESSSVVAADIKEGTESSHAVADYKKEEKEPIDDKKEGTEYTHDVDDKKEEPSAVESSKIMKRRVKTETENFLDEAAFINEIYGGEKRKESRTNILEAVESDDDFDEGDFEGDDLDEDNFLKDHPGKRTVKDFPVEDDLEDDFTFENIEF